MAKKSSMTSMRRKVISEKNEQKKAENQANSQINSLDGISSKLDDVQASSELVSETIEEKSNDIIGAVNEVGDYVQDVTAAGELTAESTEKTVDQLSKLNDTTSIINDKLSKLADMLQNKVDPLMTSSVPSNNESTALATIADNLVEQEQQPSLEDLIEKLIPDENQNPDADFFPPERDDIEEKRDDKGKKDDKNDDISKKLDLLIKGVKGGFKSSIAITDKISNMLFSYTVSALASMAKTAAMILGVIMLADIIKVNFKYWTELFKTNFEKFNNLAKEWGPLLTSISDMSSAIKDAFVDGNWGGLAIAIVKGLANVVDSLSETILLGMSKLLATILRAFDANDKADSVEGSALDRFQKRTGSQLSDEDQRKRAKYTDKEEREDDDKTPVERLRKTIYLYHTGQITEDEYKERKANYDKPIAKKDYSDKSEEDRLNIISAKQRAEAEIKRTMSYAEGAKPDDDDRMKSLQNAVNDTKSKYNEVANMSPDAAKDLKSEMDKLEALLKSKLDNNVKAEPIPVAEQPETQQSAKILNDKKEQALQQQPINNGNTVVSTNIQKNNTHVYPIQPRTSTDAPGMHGLNKPN